MAMAGKLYVLGEIDFETLDRDLAALRPKRVGVETLLEQLRGRLATQLGRGVTADQIRGVLKKHGIAVSEKRLREFIDVSPANEETGRTGVGDDGGPARGEDGGEPSGRVGGEDGGSEAGSGNRE